MLRCAAAAIALAVVSCGPTGCVSSLDALENAVAVEQTLRAQWLDERGRAVRPALASAPPADDIVIDADSSLEACLRYAVRNSPDLESAFHRWRAAVERVPQATALPDPRLGYGYFINEVETRVGAQQHRFSVSQMFPWFGKLRLRGDVAAAAANAERERLDAALLDLLWRVEDAYLEIYYLRGATEITEENLRILEQVEGIVRARYAVASASHPDLVRVQVELGKLEDRVREMRDRRRPMSARLNAVLGRPADARAPWPASLPEVEETFDAAQLSDALKRGSPALRARDRDVERFRAAGRLARRDGYPDVTVMLDYIATNDATNPSIPESGDDPLIAGVSINVPLWREKYDAGVRESIRHRLAAASGRAAEEDRLISDLELALFQHRDGLRKVQLFRDNLVPRARESLDASLRGYQTANVSFIDLLDAERVLLELQLAERRAHTDVARARARVRTLVGDWVVTEHTSTETKP